MMYTTRLSIPFCSMVGVRLQLSSEHQEKQSSSRAGGDLDRGDICLCFSILFFHTVVELVPSAYPLWYGGPEIQTPLIILLIGFHLVYFLSRFVDNPIFPTAVEPMK